MKRSVIIAIAIQFGAPCLGIALGWWLLVGWMIPRLGLGEVDRIRQLGQHIQQHIEQLEQASYIGRSDESGLAVLLGDSITREGVDTELLEQSRTDVRDLVFENWAVSGCSLAEQRVQLSLALRAKPRLVVFALGPSSLCQLQDMPLDKAFAYAYSGFVETRAWSDILPSGCGLTETALEALNSTRWRQQLHFRTAPKSWLNQRLRGAVRGGGLEQVAGDWRSPHVMSGSVGAKQLDWHLKLVEQWWREDRSEHLSAGEAILEQMAATARKAGAEPVFVLVPVHPDLRPAAEIAWRQTRPAIDRVATRHDVPCLDASARLQRAEFADALHPNQAGRARYSRYLATGLRTPLRAARK